MERHENPQVQAKREAEAYLEDAQAKLAAAENRLDASDARIEALTLKKEHILLLSEQINEVALQMQLAESEVRLQETTDNNASTRESMYRKQLQSLQEQARTAEGTEVESLQQAIALLKERLGVDETTADIQQRIHELAEQKQQFEQELEKRVSELSREYGIDPVNLYP